METPALEDLDVPIMDEYDRDEMEQLEMVAIQNPEYENAIHCYAWDHPDFADISAWENNQPADEYMGHYAGVGNSSTDSLSIGEYFNSKDEAIFAVQKWSIMHSVEYGVAKSNPSLMVFECRKGRDVCPWVLRIAALRGTGRWEVRKHKAYHTCQTDSVMSTNVHLTAKYIARDIGKLMSVKLRLTGPQIQAQIFENYGLQISPLKAWQAKQQALINLWGTWDESFASLPHLMNELVVKNPGTFVKWQTEDLDEGSGGAAGTAGGSGWDGFREERKGEAAGEERRSCDFNSTLSAIPNGGHHRILSELVLRRLRFKSINKTN